MNADFLTEPLPAPEGFRIDSVDRANWLLRKLAALDHERSLVKAQTDQMLKRIDSDETSLKNRFQSELEAFAKEQIEGAKRKSVVLHYGTLSFRTVKGRWSVSDPAAALEAARTVCPSAVQVVTTEKLDNAALVDYVDKTGEIVPGVERVPERESFLIKFKTEGE